MDASTTKLLMEVDRLMGQLREYNERKKTEASLLDAAPDLLAACEYVVRYHREHDSGEGELFGLDFVTTCIAAIAKAKGE